MITWTLSIVLSILAIGVFFVFIMLFIMDYKNNEDKDEATENKEIVEKTT